VFPIVFYVSKEGFRVYDGKGGSVICHYLEMSKTALGESSWFPECSDIGATERGIGYGMANTYKILNAKTSKRLTEVNCAAYRCSKYSTPSTKAGDWWLPSQDELDLIYENQKDTVLATCGDSWIKWYWSSCESDNIYAWLKNFGEDWPGVGEWLADGKGDSLSVRAVRAF